jgi:phosphohistidine phosphatase
MMDLYLLRHGRAGVRAEWDGPDSERPLTDAGREEMVAVSSSIAKLGLQIDAVITSPYARAFQTADILAQYLNLQDKLCVDDRLQPGFVTPLLEKVLRPFSTSIGVVLVGHEPDFSLTIQDLTGGRVILKKGGMARVRMAYPSLKKAELVWLLQPTLAGV